MTPHDRVRVDLAAARYLEALEADDHATLDALWDEAAADPAVFAAFKEVHAGLAEEAAAADTARVTDALAAAVAALLPSAGVARPPLGPVTVADVAAELFHAPPPRLPADAHGLIGRMRQSPDPLPADLGLSKLRAWAEARYGAGPPELWKAFRQAAIKLELRAAAAVEYGLAARTTPPKPEGRP